MSKGQPPELLLEAASLGLLRLGENYVQECESKRSWLLEHGETRIDWVLLGHLQRNKLGRALRLFSRVWSLDSLELARKLAAAEADERPLEVLCEVELTGLPGRSGYSPEGLRRDWEQLLQLPGIQITGLMTVAAPGAPGPAFSACRELARELERRGGASLPRLSMGMSQDFEEAIREGSTEVRIGSALMGPRIDPDRGREPGLGAP